jgi:hypothetical protein
MGRYFELSALNDTACKRIQVYKFTKFDNNDILLCLYYTGYIKVLVEIDTRREFAYWDSQYRLGMFISRIYYRLGKDAAENHIQSVGLNVC